MASLGPELEATLKQRFALARAGTPDRTGLVHTEQQGNEWITFLYTAAGAEAIHRRTVTNFKTDPCFNWVVDVTATALFGLIDIMGIPLSTGAAAKALKKLLGKPKIWKAVGEVLEATITADTIIGLVKALNDGGGLKTFVKAVLDAVSWWDYFWRVVQVVIELVLSLIHI